jgi:hypothetical protein
MTKAENRAAARAYQQEKMRKLGEAIEAERVKADLEQLQKLRDYLIFKSRTGVPGRPLIDAIDDYVEKLTGDRRSLHAQNHSIGGG